MANPLMKCKQLMAKISPEQLESLADLLEKHSPAELERVATLLDATSKALDPQAALDAARVEVEKKAKKP